MEYTECPNCPAIWGFDEIDEQKCFACGFPDCEADDLDDDDLYDDYDPFDDDEGYWNTPDDVTDIPNPSSND